MKGALLVTLAIMLSAAQALAADDRMIAILPLDVRMTKGKLSDASQSALEETIRNAAANALSADGWTVLSGETTLQKLADNDVDAEKCRDHSCHLDFARKIKTQKFISGSIAYEDGEFVAFIRLIDTSSGRILVGERVKGKNGSALENAFEQKAPAFFAKINGEDAAAPPPDTEAGATTKEGKGWLKVSSEPSGASVLIDGDDAGKTPLRKQLAAGSYAVSVERDGYTPATKTVAVAAGKEEVHFERLLKAAGWIEVSVTPPGAQVTVDGAGAGEGKQGPYAVGKHVVHAEASGYAAAEQAVAVENGGTVQAALALEALPGKLLLTVNVAARCEAAGKSADVSPSRVGVLHVPAGTVQVMCHADGHDDATQEASVEPGKSASVKLVLLTDEKPRAGKTKVEPKSGLEFVYLPGGTFHYGCEPGDGGCYDDEKPGRNATVQAMWMGKTDVTVEAYAKCVSAGACTKPTTGAHCNWDVSGREKHPMNCLDWNQAKTFCEWIGGRLPTAEEWEFAAKGGEARIYPWGNAALTGERANFCDKKCKEANPTFNAIESEDDGWPDTSPVGSYPKGASKHGLLDMSGNVWQWTASNYNATTKELRGGSWFNLVARFLRASHRNLFAPAERSYSLGARCGQ